VYDVTGAGDTVSAALGCGIAAGLSLLEATALANLAAGVVVGKLGTATASLDELYAAMDAHSPLARGRMGADALISAAQRARAAGERIAVIVGPVGVPGAALLARLEQAGRQADRVLLVEPADTDADALAVLAALRQVDWVVSADPAGHADLLARIGPHLLLPARP
jgi:D-beta-D-heptose 7-phosphate kinase/D-beta-D-heptose 1-phosphate adenosyltransferase